MAQLGNSTVIMDIDGCLFVYDLEVIKGYKDPTLTPHAKEKMDEWHNRGCKIIITTGRDEHLRLTTIRQLVKTGIPYDHLIMGIGGGKRVLINDSKPDGTITAVAYSLERNSGLGSINE
jgi:hypothetical protein